MTFCLLAQQIFPSDPLKDIIEVKGGKQIKRLSVFQDDLLSSSDRQQIPLNIITRTKEKLPRMEMTIFLVLLLGFLGCDGLPEVEISRGKRLYKGYQVQGGAGPILN